MKAVIYARVSTNMQAERETPILGQIEECKQFAASQNWEVVGVYKDEGFTGRNANRPGFQDLIRDADTAMYLAFQIEAEDGGGGGAEILEVDHIDAQWD